MPQITVYVPEQVDKVIKEQARALSLGRGQYVRALLSAVAADTDLPSMADAREPADVRA